MYSSKLSSPISIDSYNNTDEIINHLYEIFKVELMNKHKRPTLFGKFIYISCNNWIKGKAEMFWHLISLADDESFNIFPCNNCVSQTKCPENCISPTLTIDLPDGKTRNTCLYRGIRINWIKQIIDLTNKNDSNIKFWVKPRIVQGVTRKQLHIRFQHETVDYLLIFEEKYENGVLSHYYFVTAFPVFYINKKHQYQEDYQTYIESLSGQTKTGA